MVPTERFELSTSPLPRECSTPELCGPGSPFGAVWNWRLAAAEAVRQTATGTLSGQAPYGTDWVMTENKSKAPAKVARELRRERLARALRDNLRRRKGSKDGGKGDSGAATGGGGRRGAPGSRRSEGEKDA